MINSLLKHKLDQTNSPIDCPSLQGFSIPLAAAAAGADDADVPSARFDFSLSSTEDAQGPQGSFECLQADRPG